MEGRWSEGCAGLSGSPRKGRDWRLPLAWQESVRRGGGQGGRGGVLGLTVGGQGRGW